MLVSYLLECLSFAIIDELVWFGITFVSIVEGMLHVNNFCIILVSCPVREYELKHVFERRTQWISKWRWSWEVANCLVVSSWTIRLWNPSSCEYLQIGTESRIVTWRAMAQGIIEVLRSDNLFVHMLPGDLTLSWDLVAEFFKRGRVCVLSDDGYTSKRFCWGGWVFEYYFVGDMKGVRRGWPLRGPHPQHTHRRSSGGGDQEQEKMKEIVESDCFCVVLDLRGHLYHLSS